MGGTCKTGVFYFSLWKRLVLQIKSPDTVLLETATSSYVFGSQSTNCHIYILRPLLFAWVCLAWAWPLHRHNKHNGCCLCFQLLELAGSQLSTKFEHIIEHIQGFQTATAGLPSNPQLSTTQATGVVLKTVEEILKFSEGKSRKEVRIQVAFA